MGKSILHQFIDNIPQYVWWKNLDSVFQGCNKRLAVYLGLKSPDEIVGLSDFDIYDNKKDAEFVRKIDQEIIASGKPQLDFEEYLSTPNIGKRWLSTSKIPLVGEDGEIAGTIGWFTDITEIKEMQSELSDKNKALVDYRNKLKEKTRDLELVNIDLEKFSYAASHDLKEPIRTMKVFAELLRKKESDSLQDESLEYLEFISKSAKKMSLLVDDILSYSSVRSTELKAEYVDLNQLVTDRLIDLNSKDKSRTPSIELNLPPENIRVYPHIQPLAQ